MLNNKRVPEKQEDYGGKIMTGLEALLLIVIKFEEPSSIIRWQRDCQGSDAVVRRTVDRVSKLHKKTTYLVL